MSAVKNPEMEQFLKKMLGDIKNGDLGRQILNGQFIRAKRIMIIVVGSRHSKAWKIKFKYNGFIVTVWNNGCTVLGGGQPILKQTIS